MPLKPIFDKAPLTAMTSQLLRAGMVRTDHPVLRRLHASVAGKTAPAALEGAFRLTCLLQADPDQSEAAANIRRALAAQKEDGSFDLPVCDAVSVLRACWALYEYEARKPLLEHIARWCGWAAQNWDVLLADDGVWANPADLMELLEQLYRVTGKAAVLTLVNRLSQQAMNWSGVLNTLNVQRATSRSITREELETCLSIEQGSREGYYNHFLRANSPEKLADGARACMARGWASGSGTELGAARNGWEKLQRHHGAVCGGLTSDELLEGASPSAAVSAAALGAWAEALCCAAEAKNGDWAWEPLERMALNAIPACVKETGVQQFQYVNALVEAPSAADCFRVEEGHSQRALYRMVRGCAAIASGAVMATPDGFSVNLYIPGRYQVPVGESAMVLTLRENAGRVSIQVSCRQDTKAVCRLRMPAWARSAEIAINGMESDAGRDSSACCMRIERVWHDGDVIDVTLEETLRVMDGHHQGKYVLRGAKLMCLPVTGEAWAKSLVSCSGSEAGVAAIVDDVAEWKRRGDVPADVPVLPAASGRELQSVQLTPYAEAGARIALFPGRKQA